MRTSILTIMAATAVMFTGTALAASLPDTGVTWCLTWSPSGGVTNEPCTDENSGDASPAPDQDGRFGRDAAYAAGAYSKTGGGQGSFDYTKICHSGDAAGAGTCPVDPSPGAGVGDWACTQDNITGLTWEAKVDDTSSIHHKGWVYTWYNSDPATNGGNPGAPGADTICLLGACDTESFVAAVNAEGLCGYHDWRMPSARELLTLIDFQRLGADFDYFPFAYPWSASTNADDPGAAWGVRLAGTLWDFHSYIAGKTEKQAALLVRGGPF